MTLRLSSSASLASLGTLAALTLTTAGCPTLVTCDDDETFNGTECVPFDGGNVDAGSDGGGEDPDVPCGGGCDGGVCDPATNACVACTEDNLTACAEGENACLSNACVGCVESADCTDATAPECSSGNTCGDCTGPAACEGRTDAEVCASTGDCVECDETNQDACESGVCLLDTHTCAPMGGATAICGACTADTDCAAGQVCAPTEFPVGSGTEVGNFCLWRQDAVPGPAGACSRVPPYGLADTVTTESGATATVCTPRVSTCTALLNFSAIPCGTGGTTPPTTPDPTCGITGVDDGFCRVRDSGSNRCTVSCTTYDDCPCVDETCARQYECQSNRCDFARSCNTTTGICG